MKKTKKLGRKSNDYQAAKERALDELLAIMLRKLNKKYIIMITVICLLWTWPLVPYVYFLRELNDIALRLCKAFRAASLVQNSTALNLFYGTCKSHVFQSTRSILRVSSWNLLSQKYTGGAEVPKKCNHTAFPCCREDPCCAAGIITPRLCALEACFSSPHLTFLVDWTCAWGHVILLMSSDLN